VEGHWLKGASRRLAHRASPATAISTVALFIALSGTAYAATGGNFILGKANSAASLSSLTNSAGTALRLSSKAGTPPLSVNSTVQVPKLNASLLGGSPASSFVQGTGKVATGMYTLNGQSTAFIVGTYPDEAFYLEGSCDPSGSGSGANIYLYDVSSQSATFLGLSTNTSVGASIAAGSNAEVLHPPFGTGFVTIQVVSGARIMTFTATETFQSGSPDVCSFAGQVFSNQ
jgi:hypothetical protein